MTASQTERCCEAGDFLHVLHFYTANNQNKKPKLPLETLVGVGRLGSREHANDASRRILVDFAMPRNRRQASGMTPSAIISRISAG